jgi:hypothetical protein
VRPMRDRRVTGGFADHLSNPKSKEFGETVPRDRQVRSSMPGEVTLMAAALP